MSTNQIKDLMKKNQYVLVFAYAANCEACTVALHELEQIDDDTDAIGVKFVKTDDLSFMKAFGVKDFPSIIYFEDETPSIYDGECQTNSFFIIYK